MEERQNDVEESETIEAWRAQGPLVPPLLRTISGLYATAGIIPGVIDTTEGADSGSTEALAPGPLIPTPIQPLFGEELRLDVDGQAPQMSASGTIPISRVQRLHWIARLKTTGPRQYAGGIWYKDPAAAPFGYTTVDIVVPASWTPATRKAIVRFTGPGLPARVVQFAYRSPYFHKVEFEYDTEQPIVADTQIAACAHPNRPATLPCEALTIEKAFRRSGFDVSISGGANPIPTAPGGTWSDLEMHDAMTVYWSHFAATAQWAMWVLFARQHDMGSSLGGIMFDDIGPQQRQGTAIFYDSFISNAPAGDPNPVAWVKRMHFWTAVHEMGHGFNLAHSWQKALGVPWIPLVNEPEARSFMNYPYNVAGGQSAFFANFQYRFSDAELLFMRHAPARFVRMGDALWFDHHGFQEADVTPEPPLKLQIRCNRSKSVFEFLEPVMAELKLTNISSEPHIVDENVLTTLDGITIALKRQGSTARQLLPYARYCLKPSAKVLQPGESIYGPVFLTAGLNGIDVAEPGRYVVQAALHRPDGDIVSAPLLMRITPPHGYEEEVLAQDFFTNDVGRVLAFDGSHVLRAANDVLRETIDKLGDRRVAKHARIPLALAVSRESRVLEVPESAPVMKSAADVQAIFTSRGADLAEARTGLSTALLHEPEVAAESLGHIEYKMYVDQLTDVLVKEGERTKAVDVQNTLLQILAARGVLPAVLKNVEAKRDTLKAEKAAGA